MCAIKQSAVLCLLGSITFHSAIIALNCCSHVVHSSHCNSLSTIYECFVVWLIATDSQSDAVCEVSVSKATPVLLFDYFQL